MKIFNPQCTVLVNISFTIYSRSPVLNGFLYTWVFVRTSSDITLITASTHGLLTIPQNVCVEWEGQAELWSVRTCSRASKNLSPFTYSSPVSEPQEVNSFSRGKKMTIIKWVKWGKSMKQHLPFNHSETPAYNICRHTQNGDYNALVEAPNNCLLLPVTSLAAC